MDFLASSFDNDFVVSEESFDLKFLCSYNFLSTVVFFKTKIIRKPHSIVTNIAMENNSLLHSA
jgi:hypothetical protein